MILIGLGANLDSPRHGPPVATLETALAALAAEGATVAARSGWWRSAPVPVSGQPWFVNGVARLETALGPVDLLALLHRIEAEFGRVRSVPNAPRVLDLDLLDYDGRVRDEAPVLPHPRMHERAFVLLPLQDVAPGWRHPVSGLGLEALIAALPAGQRIEPFKAESRE